MLDSGPTSSDSSPSPALWLVESAAAPVVEATPNPLLVTTFVGRIVRPEQTWTFASIVSLAGHIWTLTALVLLIFLWELLSLDSLFPAGAHAGGRPVGSNAAGIIGVAPGRQDQENGDFDESGGIVTLGAPQQIGNQATAEHEVAGDVLAAKKLAETQVATAPTPVEMPTTEVQKLTEAVATRATEEPPPENKPERIPQAVVSRRIATTTIATELAAAALVTKPTTEIEVIDVVPQSVVRRDVPNNALAAASVAPPQETPIKPAPTKTPEPTKKAADAPSAPEDSSGLARRAGTKMIAKLTTKVDLETPGAGGGAGGPGGRGGAGGRGGNVNQGPGGTGAGRDNGNNGDLRSLIISAPKPYYPRELDDAGISGRVMVRVELNDEGHVVDTKIHQTSGYAAFDRSALEGIARWRFARLLDKPWRNNVYVVPVWYKD